MLTLTNKIIFDQQKKEQRNSIETIQFDCILILSNLFDSDIALSFNLLSWSTPPHDVSILFYYFFFLINDER